MGAQERTHELEQQALRELLEPQLAELHQRLASRDTELQEAREAAELSMRQLHQVQEELEHYFLADGEKQRQLASRERELEELRLTMDSLESSHILTMGAQERTHELEQQALRELLEPQLAELHQRLASRDTELQEAREAAELSMRQLHQVQEELEHYFLADGEKQRQLASRERELEELRLTKDSLESSHILTMGAQERAQELEQQALRELWEPQLAELHERLASRDTELQDAREAAELSMQQLHQVQEELESYFLNARASDQLAQAQFEQLQRARRLMLRLQPDVPPTAPYPPALSVQVLPELAAATHNPTLQTEALLNTYAASLQRASALLERARRP